MNACLDSPPPEQIVFLLPGALIEKAGFAIPVLTLPRHLFSLPHCSTTDRKQHKRKPAEAEGLSAPERQRGDIMEYCGYCEQPLSETERVRWYDEHVHAECYEVLLADAMAIIVTEQPAQDPSKEMLLEVS